MATPRSIQNGAVSLGGALTILGDESQLVGVGKVAVRVTVNREGAAVYEQQNQVQLPLSECTASIRMAPGGLVAARIP